VKIINNFITSTVFGGGGGGGGERRLLEESYLKSHTRQLIYCACIFNHLNTKGRLLYLKTQSVPRCKHFSSRL